MNICMNSPKIPDMNSLAYSNSGSSIIVAFLSSEQLSESFMSGILGWKIRGNRDMIVLEEKETEGFYVRMSELRREFEV